MSNVYVANLEHKLNDTPVDTLAVIHAPNLADLTVSALLMIAVWDKKNCLITHSGENSLTPEENFKEFARSFEYSCDTVEIPTQDLTIKVGRISPLENFEVNPFLSVLHKMNCELEFVSDHKDQCYLGRLFRFLQANKVDDELTERYYINNRSISQAVQFLLSKIEDGEEEYQERWIYEYQDALAKEYKISL